MGKTPKNTKEKDANKDIADIIDKVIGGKVKKKKVKKENRIDVSKQVKATISKTLKSPPKKHGKKNKSGKLQEAEVKDTKTASPATEKLTKILKKSTDDTTKSEKTLRHDSKPENTIFVGNLAPNTKKKQLLALFSQFGRIISVRFRTADGKKVFKHEARKKAECLNAYVVFDNCDSTKQSLQLSGSEYKDRHIRVTTLKAVSNEIEPKRTIFVGNLKYSATDEKLYDIFSTCGEIDYVRTIRNEKGCSGIAYVCFKKSESAQLAFDLNETMLDERPIDVERYRKTAKSIQKETPKKLTGSARRVMEKNKKLGITSTTRPGKTGKVQAKPSKLVKEKKSDYRGVKFTNKKKSMSKKKPSHLEKLAKKIAPR